MEKRTRIPIVIASAVFAIILWISVNLGAEYTASVSLPLVVQNIPDDLALSQPLPEYLTARVRGEGWSLLGMSIAGDAKYQLDLRDIRASKQIRSHSELDERLRLPAGVELLELSPEVLTVTLDRKVIRTVPVEPDLNIEIRPEYVKIGPVVVEPESIKVTGAESLLNNIDRLKTKPLELKDIREPVAETIELLDTLRSLIVPERQYVTVKFDVQRFAEKEISRILVNVEGVPPNREVVLIPPRISITIRGGINQIAAIDENDFTVTVHYRDILADTSGSIEPIIEGPEDIRILIRNPQRFQYVIRRL